MIKQSSKRHITEVHLILNLRFYVSFLAFLYILFHLAFEYSVLLALLAYLHFLNHFNFSAILNLALRARLFSSSSSSLAKIGFLFTRFKEGSYPSGIIGIFFGNSGPRSYSK